MINTKIIHFQFCATWEGVQQSASVLGKDAVFLKTVEQKQKFIFLLFLGGRRTFRDHLDQMRKLGSSLNLIKYLTSPSINFLMSWFYSRGYLPYITVSLLLETVTS